MFSIFFHVGPFALHTYGLMVALGFLLAYQVARREFLRRGLIAAVGSATTRLDAAVWHIMVGALLGARVAYVGLNGWSEFVADPLMFFRIWEGGLVFYGGAIGGFFGLWIASRRWPGSLISMTDSFAAPLLLGQSLGRVGCFAAGCCYGGPTTRPWGVTFTSPDALGPLFVRLHPTQLYESASTFGLFLIALWVSRRAKRVGAATLFYCVSYGALRFGLEFFRGDDRGAFHVSLSPSQWGSLLLVGIGMTVALWTVIREKKYA